MAFTKAQQSAYFKEWRKRNMARLREHSAKWRAAHLDTARARVALFNKLKGTEYTARYREKHRAQLAERNAKRRALEIRATPPWADAHEIAKIYAEAQALGLEVDHMVPLQSKRVCGLHCEANMQLLTKRSNGAKSNRHWPDMWPLIKRVI